MNSTYVNSRMWKWVSENWKPDQDVTCLKQQWLKQNGFKKHYRHSCFFCEYAYHFCEDDDFVALCEHCPARLVTNQNWHCDSRPHSWNETPKAFYRELVRLDKKRKAS